MTRSSPRRRGLLRPGAAAALGALALTLASARARAGDDVQPAPPILLFADPDEPARKTIDELVQNGFGDVSKAVVARDLLVRRFGLWAVRPLVERTTAGANEAIVRNAVLTLGSLRRAYGPSQHLWPAVPALAATVRREGSEPWRRAFAALALGLFYGPETVRRGAASREGTEEGAAAARKALGDANAALLKALADGNWVVTASAALALGKIGGTSVASARAAVRRASPPPAAPEARVADLLSIGLLPLDEDATLVAALHDDDRRVRAAAALAIACWAVAEVRSAPTGALAASASARAVALDAALRPSQNVALREGDVDGAEAAFARGMLALLSGRSDTWDELFELATRPTTERRTATAAAQALLFAPRQAGARARLADLVGRENAGRALHPTVVAAALLIAGSDGTDRGVEVCKDWLRDRGRDPHGDADGDVRFYGAIGLVRALVAGRVAPERRELAVRALSEAVRAGLVADDARRDARSFRQVLRDLVRPLPEALARDPDARPDPRALVVLEGSFSDPDAIAADDPTDVVVDRLNDAVLALYGLDALPRAVVVGGSGERTPSREDQELRFLLGWLERDPYFVRLDLLRDRGRLPAPPTSPPGDDELDR